MFYSNKLQTLDLTLTFTELTKCYECTEWIEVLLLVYNSDRGNFALYCYMANTPQDAITEDRLT